MKKRTLSILLILVMVVCFGTAVSYPIKYFMQKESNETDMEALRAMRVSALDNNAGTEQTPSVDDHAGEETPSTGGSVLTDAAVGGSEETSQSAPEATPAPSAAAGSQQGAVQAEAPTTGDAEEEAKGVPEATAVPGPTEEPVDRFSNEGYALAYSNKDHVQFDESEILPQYREIYQMNNDLVGWLSIPGTTIDYPVMRNEDSEYYLDRDFFGEHNYNGQLILDSACDPWTPSYNLVISGHNMKSGAMFAQLANYASRSYWSKHKTFTFDSIIREGTYVVVAAFYSADYDEDEEGFRYNADIQYRLDAKLWLEDVVENAEYETGIDIEFGDEFLTLTTCLYHRKNGRFVVVARRIREGEVIE